MKVNTTDLCIGFNSAIHELYVYSKWLIYTLHNLQMVEKMVSY